jgi:LysR family transcriptional regulator for metE and metH
MIAQWVASNRGVAALPAWAIVDELTQGSIIARPLGEGGMHTTLYLAFRRQERDQAYVAAFIETARAAALKTLKDIRLAS